MSTERQQHLEAYMTLQNMKLYPATGEDLTKLSQTLQLAAESILQSIIKLGGYENESGVVKLPSSSDLIELLGVYMHLRSESDSVKYIKKFEKDLVNAIFLNKMIKKARVALEPSYLSLADVTAMNKKLDLINENLDIAVEVATKIQMESMAKDKIIEKVEIENQRLRESLSMTLPERDWY